MKPHLGSWPTFAVILLAACGTETDESLKAREAIPDPQAPPRLQVEVPAAQDSLVYSVALDAIYTEWPKGAPLVIQREAKGPQGAGSEEATSPLALGEFLPALLSSTELSFREHNRQATTLDRVVRTQRPLHWISRRDIAVDGNPESEWAAFARKYSGSPGITGLSRIGYSQDGQQALLYHSLLRQHESFGEYVLLQRQAGNWQVRARQTDRVS
jgi:hypothetical protein